MTDRIVRAALAAYLFVVLVAIAGCAVHLNGSEARIAALEEDMRGMKRWSREQIEPALVELDRRTKPTPAPPPAPTETVR